MNKGGKFLFLFFFLLTRLLVAQQSVVLTQFSQDKTSFNPAYTSASKVAYASVFHRTQWLGYEDVTGAYGAPSTQYMNIQVPVDIAFGSALGFSLLKDDLGPTSTVDLRLALSVMKRVGLFDLSIGLQPSFKTRSIRSDVLLPVNKKDPTLNDLLQTPDANSTAFDLNIGAAVSAENYTFGLSMLNALESNIGFFSSEDILSRELNLYGAYNFDVAYKFSFNPFLLIRSNFSSQTFDLGGMIVYEELYALGLSFRNEESLSFLFSLSEIKESNLSVGFSLDFVISNLSDKNFNSIELFASYNLPDLGFGNRKIIRTPRFRY